ncbi:MAG: hypothetical protein HC767_14110 [Akkermansiaceae bacterium]|nr:hypothetical protein [Akkermansiaceae bacterium]
MSKKTLSKSLHIQNLCKVADIHNLMPVLAYLPTMICFGKKIVSPLSNDVPIPVQLRAHLLTENAAKRGQIQERTWMHFTRCKERLMISATICDIF